jgi:hypothetical protein
MGALEIVEQVAPFALSLLSLSLQGFATFKKSKVEDFFGLLLTNPEKGKEVLMAIVQREDLQWLFYSILDRVGSEERKEKIRNWRNLLVHLATDFAGVEFKDTYTKTLDSLSALDLLVLHQAYTTSHEKGKIEQEVVKLLVGKGIEIPLVVQSMKRLAGLGLLDELQDTMGVRVGSDEPILAKLNYDPNEFGRKFLQMISDDEIR